MVTIKIQNEQEGTEGTYTELGAVIQIAEIIHKSDEVNIDVQYKKRGQAVESSSSIKNPTVKD